MNKPVNDFWVKKFQKGQIFPFQHSPINGKDFYYELELDFENIEGLEELLALGTLKELIETDIIKLQQNLNTQDMDKFSALVDPYVYYLCDYIGGAARSLMGVDNYGPEDEEVSLQKQSKRTVNLHSTDKPCRLSGQIGLANCLELAIIGQYLLQSTLSDSYQSFFASGFHADDMGKGPNAHSFIVINNIGKRESYIFDIAQPICTHQPEPMIMEQILKPEIYISSQSILEAPDFTMIPARPITSKKELLRHFGIGSSRASIHDYWLKQKNT